MRSNFDFIAPVYDQLAGLVFGKSIIDSQLYFLNEVPDHASVLILGGGTGWFLEELAKINEECSVTYIEASAKMIALTNRRKLNKRTIVIQGTEDDIPRHLDFDVIITNFYLDLFPERKLDDVIQKLSNHAKPSCIWIVTDFVDCGKWWQRTMLKIMYFFFKSVSGIEASTLPLWGKKMLQHQWVERSSERWYRGFIKSVILKRRLVI